MRAGLLCACQMAKAALKRTASSVCYFRRHHVFLFWISWAFLVVLFLYTFTESVNTIHEYLDRGREENLRLFRDLYTQEAWPEVEMANVTSPREFPFTVHYFWCGRDRVFRFEHYLSVLSAVRVLKPQIIVFHYHYLPVIDSKWYHTWFEELKQSVPNLELRYTSQTPVCGSEEMLTLILSHLGQEGGVYVGERTVITHVPEEARFSGFLASFSRRKGLALSSPPSSSSSSSSDDVTQGVVYSKSGYPSSSVSKKVYLALHSPKSCFSMQEFDDGRKAATVDGVNSGVPKDCLVLWDPVYPRDIWEADTRFGELSRWLYYGHRRMLKVKPDPQTSTPIPLICHIVWIRTTSLLQTNAFQFVHFLGVLSALHVAGFDHVYVHGDVTPYGPWWDRLAGQNVTFVKIEARASVYQQTVTSPVHLSDAIRLHILLRYGGAYQDRDVIWVNKVPAWLRQYQAVACMDWPRKGAWPEAFNMAVMLAKPQAPWIKHVLRTFSYYRGHTTDFNDALMPYKAYESHPDSLFVDRHLQVSCYDNICHPAWHDDYIRDIDNKLSTTQFDWHDARAFHFTIPKPPKSLVSPEAVKERDDLFAGIGKLVLEKSGQIDLLQ